MSTPARSKATVPERLRKLASKWERSATIFEGGDFSADQATARTLFQCAKAIRRIAGKKR